MFCFLLARSLRAISTCSSRTSSRLTATGASRGLLSARCRSPVVPGYGFGGGHSIQRTDRVLLPPEPLVCLAMSEQNMSETKALVSERRTLHIVNPSDPALNIVRAPEPFVSAEEAARFLSVRRRQLLAMARRGLVGAYPLGTGSLRKVWVFRLSELAAAVEQHLTTARLEKRDNIRSGSSR